MTLGSRYTLEKLALELKLLRIEDFGNLVPISIGIHSVLWPRDNVETCFRNVQFMAFTVQKACEGKEEADRWEILRDFLFDDKGFQISSTRASNEISVSQILIKDTLEKRVGHPLPLLFLLLHLAYYLDIPLTLLQARHHFLVKWVRSGKTIYLDFFNGCKVLNDQELIQVLNRSSSNLEVWSAKQLISQYLELLLTTFERHHRLNELHTVYNLLLHLDDTNTSLLGQRALLRYRLGFGREALCDLKRYFSFVERVHAPNEINRVWTELENRPEPASLSVTDVLH